MSFESGASLLTYSAYSNKSRNIDDCRNIYNHFDYTFDATSSSTCFSSCFAESLTTNDFLLSWKVFCRSSTIHVPGPLFILPTWSISLGCLMCFAFLFIVGPYGVTEKRNLWDFNDFDLQKWNDKFLTYLWISALPFQSPRTCGNNIWCSVPWALDDWRCYL